MTHAYRHVVSYPSISLIDNFLKRDWPKWKKKYSSLHFFCKKNVHHTYVRKRIQGSRHRNERAFKAKSQQNQRRGFEAMMDTLFLTFSRAGRTWKCGIYFFLFVVFSFRLSNKPFSLSRLSHSIRISSALRQGNSVSNFHLLATSTLWVWTCWTILAHCVHGNGTAPVKGGNQ